jgi:hypothetical protein
MQPQENHESFQEILSDADLDNLFEKHGIKDFRERKLSARHFIWLIILSAAEPSNRGCIVQLISFFLGAIVIFPALTNRLKLRVLARLQFFDAEHQGGFVNGSDFGTKNLPSPQNFIFCRQCPRPR